jgi:thymidine kinase
MVGDGFLADRERRRLGSVTVYCGPSHAGKTKKLEAEIERAERQGRRVQHFSDLVSGSQLLVQLDPATELVTIDNAQHFDSTLATVADELATMRRVDVAVAGWELDWRAQLEGPMPELLCRADLVVKLDDGVCAQPGCRNLASRTQRFLSDDSLDKYLPVCRRHHERAGRTQAFQEGWFEEPAGLLDVIAGCMFSGKTQELIRRLDQERYAGSRIQVFKPALDDRYALEAVASHRQVRFPALAVPDAAALKVQLHTDTRVIGIDEAQFFGPDLVALVEGLAGEGRHVIVAGLDLDFAARPFGPMPALMSYADRLTKLQASCQFPGCGSKLASRTQRLEQGQPVAAEAPVVMIGGSGTYEARCRHHHQTLAGGNHRQAVASAQERLAGL